METKKSYSEQLRDPRWQKKRLEIMERDEWKCYRCGDSETTLNVHHGHYKKGVSVWDYPDFTLITLCESCHREEHEPKVIQPFKPSFL